MASSMAKENSHRPSVVVKPLLRSNTTAVPAKRSALGPLQHGMVTRSRKEGGGAVTNAGKLVRTKKEVTDRIRCLAGRSIRAVAGTEKPTVVVKREKDDKEEEEEKVRGGGGLATKATAKTNKTKTLGGARVPKVTAVDQSRPQERLSKLGKGIGDTTAPQRHTILARVNSRHTVTLAGGAQRTRRPQQKAPVAVPQVIDLTKGANIRKTDGRYVSKYSKKTSSATNATDLDNYQKAGKGHNVHTDTSKFSTGIKAEVVRATVRPQEAGNGERVVPRKPTLPRDDLKLVPPYEPQADIDLTEDPSMCGEYSGDIFDHHRRLEEEGHYLVCASFMEHQRDITSLHRRVLVDWLAQVHFKYRLLQETMILTVDILDRYLQIALVSKPKLQLVGLASLFISSKFEEIYAPSIYELEHIAANTYSRPEILGMEKTILRQLDYRLLKPYPIHFLRRYSRLSHTNTDVHHLSKYFIDLSLLDCEGSCLLPSKKAAAAFIISNGALYSRSPRSVWTRRLQLHTGYTLAELVETVKSLLSLVQSKHGTDKATAIRERYSKTAPTDSVRELIRGKFLGGLERLKITI